MLNFLAFLVYFLVVAGNPIKRARESLSDTQGYTQKDYLVTRLPGLTENVPDRDIPLMFAGQLPLYHENNTHYFFWKFVDRQKVAGAENKTIFWLNGGPGCSSMDGALMEAGPFRVNGDNKVTYNEGSWHRKGDVVFVDQPAGTGFSYSTEYDRELGDVSWHFLTFLERYFALFPEDLNNEILLAGESYAGQYIPYIARAVLDRNARINNDANSTAATYDLRGLLIGNGYISPNEQGLSFVPFAVQSGMITTNHPHWGDLLKAHESCQNAVAQTSGDDISAFSVVDKTCDRVLTLLLKYTADRDAPQDAQCFNMYDYTLKDEFPSCGMNWPPDLAHVTPFLAREAVMSDLNLVFHKHWTECSGSVGSHLKARKSLPAVKLLPGLLEQLQIVLFHGNKDVICNYLGAEMMIKNLKWGGSTGFSDDAVTYDWRHNGSVEGYLRSERNLTYVNVFNASHMVPFDKPEVSRAIVDLLYKVYDVRSEADEKPQILTYPIGYNSSHAQEESLMGTSAQSNSTVPGQNSSDHDTPPPTSRIVRVIQLAVIVVLIWGVCALYTTYKSKPTSIIKTKPTGRKKNVSWADQLEEAVKVPGVSQTPSLITKALNKFKKSDTQGTYSRVEDDIEMNENVPDGVDFVIGSDEEDEQNRN
ncbi:hypothetical protein OY671_001746 [Metschnikowia pulcherrima]|nr:hypothetical protein OY671_001746 [Metschnikowia pulcherrima]